MHNEDWCGIKVIIDDAVTGLFEMPEPDEDANQKPEFRATSSTAELVKRDFGLYKPSLERMLESWHEEKERFMRENKTNSPEPDISAQG